MLKRRARVLAGVALGAARKLSDLLHDYQSTENEQQRSRQRVMQTTRVAERNVLVTGSTRGIGRALAAAFVELGANVVVHGRREDEACVVARELASHALGPKQRVVGIGSDLSRAGAGRKLVAQAVERVGRLDIVINNAAVHPPERKPSWQTASDEFHEILKVNVLAAFDVSAAALANMLAQGADGRIINISTGAANIANVSDSGVAGYGISKFALEGLSHYIAAESQHVTVVTLRPDTIDTDMTAPLYPLDRRLRSLPPESVVPAVLHLVQAPRDEVHAKIFEQRQLTKLLATDPAAPALDSRSVAQDA